MLGRIRAHVTYANVVATLALFVALGGSSYAVTKIGSKDIRNNSVRSKDIRNNDLRSRDIRNRSLLAKDFKRGQVPAAGLSGYTVRRTTSGASSTRKDVIATCPAGLVAVGGGGTATGAPTGSVALLYSIPTNPPNRWRVGAAEVNGGTTANWTLSAYAVCARAG